MHDVSYYGQMLASSEPPPGREHLLFQSESSADAAARGAVSPQRCEKIEEPAPLTPGLYAQVFLGVGLGLGVGLEVGPPRTAYGCSLDYIRLPPGLHTVAAWITYGCSLRGMRLQVFFAVVKSYVGPAILYLPHAFFNGMLPLTLTLTLALALALTLTLSRTPTPAQPQP